MTIAIQFGSRALGLDAQQRKSIASYMRIFRDSMLGNPERLERSRTFLLLLLYPHPATGQPERGERTEAERCEDRHAERESHTRQALADMASYRHGAF